MRDKKWTEIVKLADHYKAIGSTDIWLSREKGNERTLPWAFVTHCEPGSSHRLDIATSVTFRAEHDCGLTFSWSMDIEDDDANGRGHYMVDVDKLERVMEWLPEKPRVSFKDYLANCSRALVASAEKFEGIAARERTSAARLAVAATALPVSVTR